QVGPEVAELLGLPQVTAARRLDVDPWSRTFVAERETDDGFETVSGPLPAVVTAAEDLAEERVPTKAEGPARAAKPSRTGDAGGEIGIAGSRPWVTGLEQVASPRRGEILTGDAPGALAAALGERLHALLDLVADERPALPARTAGAGAPVWVVVEMSESGPKP